MNTKKMDGYQVRKYLQTVVLAAVVLWAVIAFLVYPNFNILKTSFVGKNGFSLDAFYRILNSERAITSFRNSFLLAVTLSITVNIVGVFITLVTEYFDIKGAKFLKACYLATFICGGIVLVTAYKFMYGADGIFTNVIAHFLPINKEWFGGFGAVLFTLTFSRTTNHLMFLSNAIRSIDNQTIEAAQCMGVSQFKILWKIVLPTLRPNLFAVTILVFLYGFNALAAPLVLGGEEFQTINPLILSFSQTLTTRNYAAIMAMILGFLTIILIAVLNHIEKKGNYMSVSKVKTKLRKQKIQNPIVNVIVHILAYLIAAINLIPAIMIVIFSFMSVDNFYAGKIGKLTLNNYLQVFSSSYVFRPILVSIGYSALGVIIAAALMLMVGRLIQKHKNPATTFLEYVLHIPWFLPGTMIALGLVMTYDIARPILFNQILTGTMSIMLVGYIIVKIPFTLRMIKAAYYGVDNSLEEAARNLGISSFVTFFKIILPIVIPATVSVMLINFASLLGDYNLSVFLFHPIYQPLGVVIRNATNPTANPDSKMLTFVYAVVIMIINTAVAKIAYGSAGSKKVR
ncbi:iron ABC transporter permease [Clostridiales bacterium COT073_COT-073]|nr:iron ABC transporter permease [Clostridiales bacterium COT073_COT-073]